MNTIKKNKSVCDSKSPNNHTYLPETLIGILWNKVKTQLGLLGLTWLSIINPQLVS